MQALIRLFPVPLLNIAMQRVYIFFEGRFVLRGGDSRSWRTGCGQCSDRSQDDEECKYKICAREGREILLTQLLSVAKSFLELRCHQGGLLKESLDAGAKARFHHGQFAVDFAAIQDPDPLRQFAD